MDLEDRYPMPSLTSASKRPPSTEVFEDLEEDNVYLEAQVQSKQVRFQPGPMTHAGTSSSKPTQSKVRMLTHV